MFRTAKLLDISTGHLEQVDVELLETKGYGGDNSLSFSCIPYEEGFFVNLSCLESSLKDGTLNKDVAEFSHHFERLVKLAIEHGCQYINFDRDGEVYSHLPTFDW